MEGMGRRWARPFPSRHTVRNAGCALGAWRKSEGHLTDKHPRVSNVWVANQIHFSSMFFYILNNRDANLQVAL